MSKAMAAATLAVLLLGCGGGDSDTGPSEPPGQQDLVPAGTYALDALRGSKLPIEVPSPGVPAFFARAQLIADTLVVANDEFTRRTVMRDSLGTATIVVGGEIRPFGQSIMAFGISGWNYEHFPNQLLAVVESVTSQSMSWRGGGPWYPNEFEVFVYRRVP